MSINDLGKIRYGEFYIKAWLSIAYVSVKKLIHFFLALIRFMPYCIYMIKIIETIMDRDGLSLEDATNQVEAFKAEMFLDVTQGGDIWAWEELFTSEFQLEPDFFEDLAIDSALNI